MKLRTLNRAGRMMASWIGGAALLMVAPFAMAVPPSFNGSLTAPIPAIGQSVIVNLRQQGVVAGSAPMSVAIPGQGNVLLNGQLAPFSGLTIAAVDLDTASFGTVCVQITNLSYTVSIVGTLSTPLSATNALQETGSIGAPGITLINAAGPTVNPQDPAQVAACEDPNRDPVVSINGGSRTVNDMDGAPGENVALSATATDPE